MVGLQQFVLRATLNSDGMDIAAKCSGVEGRFKSSVKLLPTKGTS